MVISQLIMLQHIFLVLPKDLFHWKNAGKFQSFLKAFRGELVVPTLYGLKLFSRNIIVSEALQNILKVL